MNFAHTPGFEKVRADIPAFPVIEPASRVPAPASVEIGRAHV